MAQPTIIIEPPEAAAAGCTVEIDSYSSPNVSASAPSGIPGKDHIKTYSGNGYRVKIKEADGWVVDDTIFHNAPSPSTRRDIVYDTNWTVVRDTTSSHTNPSVDFNIGNETGGYYSRSGEYLVGPNDSKFLQIKNQLASFLGQGYPWGDTGVDTDDDWDVEEDERGSLEGYRNFIRTYNFTLNSITVRFRAVKCRIVIKMNPDSMPEDGDRHSVNHTGTVTGAGDVVQGSTVEVSATPNNGYRFLYWAKTAASKYGDSDFLSASATYRFTAPTLASYELYAHFDGVTPGIIYNPLASGNPIAYRPDTADGNPIICRK